ncbi:hypothetical protein K432DRAFT_428190 [Lepidopterella palustris CBS 459.81]|uniref:Uncharacterized protein n=1 Tax=Lepidopterella palustris CBS 459.81 TaxID=1314670 RepID=A0A8E2E4D5_9PEZI|nr:hypothetical protein K432DRAFT_428190 [Lepidopterella palustris CBS 459.81]
MLTDESPDRPEHVKESKNSNEQLDDDLDPAQIEIIRLCRAKFHVKYGNKASPKELFSSAASSVDWMIFLLSWPATGFRILKLQKLFGEVDELFIPEYELNSDGILTPFLYFGEVFKSRLDNWRFDIDLLIQGVGSNKLWEFRQVAQKPEHADLCQKIARDLGLMEEAAESKVRFVLRGAQERSQILTESLETLDRISTIRREAKAAKEAREAEANEAGLRRRQLLSSSEQPESDKETTGETGPQLRFPSSKTTVPVAQASGLDQDTLSRLQAPGGERPRVTVPLLAPVTTSGIVRGDRHRLTNGPWFHQRPVVQRNARALSTQSNIQPAPQSKKRRGVHLFINRIAHRTAVLFLFPLILALSAGLIAVSTTRSRSLNWHLDDGFFTCSSAACLQLFSLYLLILPILRKRALEIPKDWFVLSIGLSTLSAIVSVIVYPYSWEASGILGFFANVAATIATVQLIEGTDAGIRVTLGPFYSD